MPFLAAKRQIFYLVQLSYVLQFVLIVRASITSTSANSPKRILFHCRHKRLSDFTSALAIGLFCVEVLAISILDFFLPFDSFTGGALHTPKAWLCKNTLLAHYISDEWSTL
jgi:hypothetical protein